MAIHAVMCGGENKHVCVRVCLCVLRTCVSVSRGELRPSSPPAPRAHVVSCGPLLEVLLSFFGIWAALGACWGRPGLLGSCAPGEDFDENQLIKYGSRGLFETLLSSLGNGAAVAASWGTPWAPGLLGRTSRAPAEAGATLESHFSHGREGARGGFNNLPRPLRGTGDKISYKTR